MCEEKRKQINANIKVATCWTIFREALLARLHEHEANEPREGDDTFHRDALTSARERIAELEITQEHVLGGR
jgi:hypothetical protein